MTSKITTMPQFRMPQVRMPQARLGRDGPLIGVQGLGCMGMSEFYGRSDDAESRATLERALELGVTMFDTADMYGLGANEKFLAPFIAANREKVLIATKFGYVRTTENPNDWAIDNRPSFIHAAADRSLRRLGVETIDLYYMHRRIDAVPLEDSIGAMSELVRAGKVKQLGLSAVTAEELRAAHAVHPIAALQSEWSIFTRGIEDEVVATATELGVTIIPYAPLGRGMLTGQALADISSSDDTRQNFPRFSTENRSANMRLVAKVEALATARNVTPAQLALGWLYARATSLGASVVPIPGTRKRHRLEENVTSVSIELAPQDLEELSTLAAAVQGAAV